MKKNVVWILKLFVLSLIMSCAPKELIKTDLQSFLKNPQEYEGKRVIITTDLKTLTENPTPYLNKDIELYGFVEFRYETFDWDFFLKDEEGRKVICYEEGYRHSSWAVPTNIIKLAERKNDIIVVVGKLKRGLRIELDWIEYNGRVIDTDYKPEKHRPHL